MLVSVLFVKYVAARIWKVKDAFDVSRTETMSFLGSPETPVLLTMDEIRSRRVAVL